MAVCCGALQPDQTGKVLTPALQQLVRIHIDSGGDVFGQRQLVERLAHQAAQTQNGAAPDQNVKAELALQFFHRPWRGERTVISTACLNGGKSQRSRNSSSCWK